MSSGMACEYQHPVAILQESGMSATKNWDDGQTVTTLIQGVNLPRMETESRRCAPGTDVVLWVTYTSTNNSSKKRIE